MTDREHDLGSGVYFRWLTFAPDRDLNPQLAHLPDNDRTGIIIGHFHAEGACARHTTPEDCTNNPKWCSNRCEGTVLFDTPENGPPRTGPVWQVVSLDPLHIEPSILKGCGFHGWIRDGRWVAA